MTEFENSIINGNYVPGSEKVKLKLNILFYFIIRVAENEHKVIFMNYKISEDRLFWVNITKYLQRDFMKFGIKTLINNQMDLHSKHFVECGYSYEFKLGGFRKEVA